jgi:hypothetical protein
MFVGVVVLIVAGISLIQARKAKLDGEPSWLAVAVVKLVGGNKPPPEPTKPEDVVKIDNERIQQTQQRMEAALSRVMEYRRQEGAARYPTIRDLRAKGLITAEETRDSWGNDFIVTSSNGGMLIAAGRDREEGTGDDFQMSLSGARLQMPKPLSVEELATQPN